MSKPTLQDAASIIHDLLDQIGQMRGMFDDEDGCIESAVTGAEEFLRKCGRFEKAVVAYDVYTNAGTIYENLEASFPSRRSADAYVAAQRGIDLAVAARFDDDTREF